MFISLSPICPTCGGVRPGATVHMVNARPCSCAPGTNLLPWPTTYSWTHTDTTHIPVIGVPGGPPTVMC